MTACALETQLRRQFEKMSTDVEDKKTGGLI